MRSVAAVVQFACVAWADLRPLDYTARPMLAVYRPLQPAPALRSVLSPALPSQSRTTLRSATMHYPPQPSNFETVDESADTVTLYRISGSECSQAVMKKRAGDIIMRLVKLKPGTCASLGFVEAVSAETMTAPIVGEITVNFFRKLGETVQLPADDVASSATVTLYKISKQECGETMVDRTYAAFAVYFANLKKGTCASQGFTQPDGRTQKISLPLLGKTNINYFKRELKVRGPLRPFRAKVRALSIAASTAAAAGEAVTGASRTGRSNELPETSSDQNAQQLMETSPISSTVVLIGLMVSSGIVFASRRFHRGVSSEEPLLSV